MIDHILVTDKRKVVTHGVFDPCISDHSLVYIVLSFKRERKPPIYITVKNYKDVDIKTLQSDFQQTPWWVTSVFDDIDDTTSVWNDMYQAVIKEHINTRKVKVRSNSLPWMNSNLRKIMNKRYKLLIAAQKTGKVSKEWKEYKTARNKCTLELRKAKDRYWKENFSKAKSVEGILDTCQIVSGKRFEEIKQIKQNWFNHDK